MLGQFRHFFVLTDHDARRHLNLRHGRTQALETLRQLAPDRPAAQHHHAFGNSVQLEEFVPQRVAGHITHIVDARQRRHKRLGAGRDHDGARCESLFAAAVQRNLNRPRVDDFRVALQHLDAQAGVPLHAVMRLDGGYHGMDALHYSLEAELGHAVAQAVLRAVFHLRRQLRALDQGLARHAAVVETVTAHLVRLHQRHLGLHHRRDVGRNQPARTAANHDQVAVKLLGLEVVPFGVHLARLHGVDNLFRNQWKYAEQHKRADQAGRQNALERIDLGQLCACIDVNHGAEQHADLAHPIKRPGFHLGQTHDQVDDEKRHQRHEAQGKQVKRALFLNPFVDLGHARGKLVLHGLAQYKSGREESQCRADAGGKRDDQRADTQPENGAAHQRHDGSAGQGKCRYCDVDHKEGRDHHGRPLRVQLGEVSLLRLDVGQAEKPAQIKNEKKCDEGDQCNQYQRFLVFHGRCVNWEVMGYFAPCRPGGPGVSRRSLEFLSNAAGHPAKARSAATHRGVD